jgi:hypothetical protein
MTEHYYPMLLKEEQLLLDGLLFCRWFFAGGDTCQEFTWGGCGGNANNFLTRQHCLARCNPQESEKEEDIIGKNRWLHLVEVTNIKPFK